MKKIIKRIQRQYKTLSAEDYLFNKRRSNFSKTKERVDLYPLRKSA